MSKHLVLAAAAASVFASASFAQENFTLKTTVTGPAQSWNTGANWVPEFGFTNVYPGQTLAVPPDNANLNVALGANSGLVISGGPIVLTQLSIGSTAGAFTTEVSGATAADTVTASTINTLGAAGAVNRIVAPFMMPNGNLTINTGGTNALTLGNLINSPTGSFRNINNNSGQTLTINNVALSNNATNGQLRFVNSAAATQTVIEGVISNGTAGSGSVNYAGGIFHIKNANTTTGTTQLGEGSPSALNIASTHVIYTDTPFGTGRINFSGGTAIKTVEGAASLGTRTLANEIQLSRDARFAGAESVVLTGQMFQSNSRSLINDITAGKSLTISGPVFAASSSDNRIFLFTGSGLTNFQSTLDDTTTGDPAISGTLRVDGTGRVIASNAGMALYQGNTEVYGGTLQLGTGTVAVNIPNTILSGGGATVGTVEFNHSGTQTVNALVKGQLNIRNTGTGTTTLNGTSFANGGTINVNNGKLVLNGADHPAVVIPSATKVSGSTINVGNTAGIVVGQPVFVSTDNGGGLTLSSDAYVTQIIDATQVLLNGGGAAGGTNGVSTNEVTFRMGTATGTSSVIVAAGAEVGGTGTIGGLLGVNGTVAPGNSIGTMSVLGNAVINGTYDAEYDALLNTADLLDVNGSLTLGAASVLDLQAIGGLADDNAYIVASYGSLFGTFNSVLNLPSGYEVNYAYNGNNIAVVIPEPATLGLLGLGSLLGLRRRR